MEPGDVHIRGLLPRGMKHLKCKEGVNGDPQVCMSIFPHEHYVEDERLWVLSKSPQNIPTPMVMAYTKQILH